MSQEKDSKAGPLTQLMVEDHRRLDAWWQSAVRDRQHIDHAAYDQFRAGLLRPVFRTQTRSFVLFVWLFWCHASRFSRLSRQSRVSRASPF
jgi:hypothetical protein